MTATVAAMAACTGHAPARAEPARPQVLSALLRRGALASAALTLDVPRAQRPEPGDDAPPEALGPRAAQRYTARALPVAPKGNLAMARLRPGDRPVAIAIGDFSAPLVVVDDPGPPGAPLVLLEGANVRLLARLPRGVLRDVTTESAVLAVSPGAAAPDASLRIGPGLPLERIGRVLGDGDHPDLAWVRYRDPEVEAVGVVEPRSLGQVYRPAAPGEPTAADAQVQTPLFLFDRPGGRPFATIRAEAGLLVPALRVRVAGRHALVRIDLSRDVTLTGWVPASEVELTVTHVKERSPGPAPGRWLSISGLQARDLRCVELPRATRLRARPRGPVVGLVTRDDRFFFLGEPRPGWLEVGIGHPFGLARLWVPAGRARPTRCERADPGPGSS